MKTFPRSSSLHTEAAGTAPPDAFGPFRVLHQVGAGTLGPVFRTYDPERDALVAVKLFTLDLPPERVHQLVGELERLIAASLTHEAIAAPLATGFADASAYLALEYIAAESLDLAVRAYGPAPAGDALRVTAQLAGALDFAAAVNVHHGALHPRDVLLAPDQTRLTGLGIAHALEQVGVAAPARRPYTAPERIAGAGWDRRADVFSLAALTHELLWGRRIAGTGAQVADAITAVPRGDTDALRAVFARALAEDPEERFGTALEFAEALQQAFPGVMVVAPPLQRESREEAEPQAPLGDPEPADAPVAVVEPDIEVPVPQEPRYAAIEPAPSIVERSDQPEVQTPSHTWPLAVMLIFGVVAGLTGGYVAWSRSDAIAPRTPIVAVTEPEKPATPAGREFTEGTVPEASRAGTPNPRSPEPRNLGTPEPRNPGTPEPRNPGTPEPRNPGTRNPGRLLVRSTPSGASVFVDGREYGQTPVAVRDLPRGVHRVRVVRDGYAPAERRIVITASRPAQSIVIPLAAPRVASSRGERSSSPAPSTTIGRFTGDLVVESKPPGAKVYVDNTLVGTTPLSLRNVAAGSHAVRLERDGYRRWSSSIRVVAAERNRVTASLDRLNSSLER